MRQAPAARLFATAALLLLLLPAAAGPAAADPPRVLLTETTDAPGWVALLLYVLDGSVTVWTGGETHGPRHARGIVELDDANVPLRMSASWSSPLASGSARQSALASPSAAPEGHAVALDLSRADAVSTLRVTRPGVTTVVVWSAGDYARWSYQVSGSAGATLLDFTRGSGTFLHTADDFEGTLHASALAGSASARATVDGTLALDVEHSLFSLYYAGHPLAETASVQTPTDLRRACPCWFAGPAQPGTPSGPGAYDFRLDGAHAARTREVMLTGADVVLPRS